MQRKLVTLAGPVVAALLLALAVRPASAQLEGLEKLKSTTPQQRATAQTAVMKEKLDLKEAQLPKVEAINLKYAEKMEPVIKGSGGPLMKLGQAQQISHDKEEELRGVLTVEQFQKYQVSKQEMKEKFEQKIAAKVRERAQ